MISNARRIFSVLCALLFALCLFPEIAEAAQLIIGVVGAGLGFLVGGPLGAAVDFMAGNLLGGLLFPPKGQNVVGPRMSDKTVQSAAYGSHINKTWGTDRVQAELIFSSGLKEHKHVSEVGGKGIGGGSATSTTFTYSVDIMLSFGEHAKGFLRLWADTKLIYDATGTADIKKKWLKQGKRFVVRDGNEAQLPSALEESYHGAGQCSAHRGLFCLEAEDFQLADFANRIPNFTAEIFTEGDATFGVIGAYEAPPTTTWHSSWGFMDDLGDVWALYFPPVTPYWYPEYSSVFHWTLATPNDPVVEPHPLWSGEVVQSASIAESVALRSDEHSAAVFGTNDSSIWMSYFRLEEGTRIDIPYVAGMGIKPPYLAVKFGEDIYVRGGDSTRHLYHFNLSGTLINDSAILDPNPVSDMGRSENYLWVMTGGNILKLDPDTLALVATIDISSIVAPLAMAVVSETEIRVVASVSGQWTRFYKITNEGTPVLDAVDLTTSYFGIGQYDLRYINGMYVLSSDGSWGGFSAFIVFYGSHPATADIPLWKIVRDINLRAGLDSAITSIPPSVGDVRVNDLIDMVHGYSITRTMPAREALVQLRQCYFFDCRETDLKLDYVKRGKAAVKSLPGDDLAARSSLTEELPDRLTQTRIRESELPLRFHIIYNNWEASYQPGHEYAPRLITEARKTETIEISVAITSTQARKIVDAWLAVAWLERETFQLKASRKHMRIDAADNVEVVITEE